MLCNVMDLGGYGIDASDGTIGHVEDFYFDDQTWAIRYLVAATGGWVGSRNVLISPISIGIPDQGRKLLPVAISKEQVRMSPAVDTDKPVSLQHEKEARLRDDDPHLRSCNAVSGYHVHASDGEIGHVEGLLVDDETWAILYLIVNTSNWWVGHKVLIATDWIQDVSWFDSMVSINAPRQAVKDAPAYDSAKPLDRQQEMRLYMHYGKVGYWAGAEIVETDIVRI